MSFDGHEAEVKYSMHYSSPGLSTEQEDINVFFRNRIDLLTKKIDWLTERLLGDTDDHHPECSLSHHTKDSPCCKEIDGAPHPIWDHFVATKSEVAPKQNRPNLLEACKDALVHVRNLDEQTYAEKMVQKILEAAIAKAEGK